VHINKPQQGQYVYDPACVSAQCPLLDGSAAYDQQLHRVQINQNFHPIGTILGTLGTEISTFIIYNLVIEFN
jgi:hypothetical protein